MRPTIPILRGGELFKKRITPSSLYLAYERLASAEFMICRMTEAIEFQEKAIAMMIRIPEDRIYRITEAYRYMSIYYMANEQWERAKQNIDVAIDMNLHNKEASILQQEKCIAGLGLIESKVNSNFQFDEFFEEIEKRIKQTYNSDKLRKLNKEFTLLYFTNFLPLQLPQLPEEWFELHPVLERYHNLVQELLIRKESKEAILVIGHVLALADTWGKEELKDKLLAQIYQINHPHQQTSHD